MDEQPPTLTVSPDCPHAKRCPGCPAIGLPYHEQLALKSQLVRDAFLAFSSLAGLEVARTHAAQPIVGYRTRAKLVADPGGALGLFAEGTHEVVDSPDCLVLEPNVARVVGALRELLREKPILEGVDVVAVDGGVLVTLIASPSVSKPALGAFADVLRSREPGALGIAISRRSRGAVRLLGSDLRVVWGVDVAHRRLAADMPTHAVSHGGFVQAHDRTAEAIQRALLAELQRVSSLASLRVLELYAGAGAFSLWLAAQGAVVTSVESFGPACERLVLTARERGLSLQVVADDAARALGTLAMLGATFDAVIVNPPRRGLDPRVRQALLDLAPAHLLYVSCNPATLARDVAHFSSSGVRVRALETFDMLPLTQQVETLAVLERGPQDGPNVLYADEELLVLDKSPHQSMEEAQSCLVQWVRARPGFGRAIPSVMLGTHESGVVAFVRDPDTAAALTAALAQGTRSFQVLAKGVTHGKGRISKPASHRARYQRLKVVGGHALLEVTTTAQGLHALRQQLRSLRHPLIGDPRSDPHTKTHFQMRHGLDRAFLHCTELTLVWRGESRVFRAELAGDLALVLASLAAIRKV